ncbi:MAG TPA: response regulator [Bacillus bacterium]|nr:response regulator [Bacillus sp. (in: firmicutes)]
MNFKRKLYLGFGSVLVVMIIIATYGLQIIQEQKQNMKYMVNVHYEKVRLVTLFQFEINNTARMIRDVILKKEEGFTKEEEELISISRTKTADALKLLKQFDATENEKTLITKLDVLNQSYGQGLQQISELLKNGEKGEASKVLIEDYRDVRIGLVSLMAELTSIEEEAVNEAVEKSKGLYDSTFVSFVFLIVISLFIVILITVTVVRSIIGRIHDVNKVISSVADLETNTLPRIEKITDDEIGEIAVAYNGMADSLESHMEHEHDLKKEMQLENWVKSNFIDLTTMSQGIQNVQEFARLFITKITPIIGASVGTFYLKDENEEMFHKIAAYADYDVDETSKVFRLGEGLIGQAALENKNLLLDTLPEDYIKIKSGLGQSSPRYLYVLPISYENKVIAVFELGSFTPFENHHKRLIDFVINTVGVRLHGILGHMKIEKLLIESQTLTEELQSQSEELQQQQEELRVVNEQLEEQYKNSEEKTKELEQIQLDLEEKNRHVELSSKYKSQFLANMSHELRTPLNSMLILSQLLGDNNENNLSGKQVEYAHTIHSAGKDLLDLINDILDLSKIESGKTSVLPEEILFAEIKYFVENQFMPLAKQKNLNFEVIIDEDLPYVFITDNQRLKQILKNLLSNAFKFTQEGKVTIEFKLCKRQNPFMKEHKSMVAISVADTGIGIAEDKQKIIFEAFSQADGTTSRQFGGTGLGLSISKELAQLLGGFIEVESTIGKGSTFTLYLPEYEFHLNNELRNKEVAVTEMVKPFLLEKKADENVITLTGNQQSKSPELRNIKELLAGKKVLLVDDDMRNIFSLTSALESNKMVVEFAENGKEALEILQHQSDIDLVLMDIMMPVMNGYEAIKAIRKIEGFEHLPIIALTAKAMKHDREKCLDAGASDYISKPVHIEQLLSLIRVWIYR